ncbi:MAG: molybdate ABC transporter permease subunit [Candidatus Firestonebacteria bacterium]|nr:molybdate ABC transporter permease subunit [Candidatus Firestonebacteria bacterium]
MDWSVVDFQALWLSTKVAVVATLVSLPFGMGLATLLTFKSFRGKTALELLLMLPLTLPPVVIGYILLILLGQHGWLGSLLRTWGIQILFTWKAAVLASAVVGFPLLVRALRLQLENLDPRLFQAARTLGASRTDVFFSLILPLSGRGLLSGSSLLFARSLGEFGATIIVAGNIPGVTQTLPLAIYDYAGSPGGGKTAWALCAVAVVVSLAVLGLQAWLAKKISPAK